MVRFAQFGAGFIGTIHGANLAANPRAHLQYIYDVNRAAAETLAQKHGAKVANHPDEIWAAGNVDAVLIASSTNTHAELLSAAIQAGKPAYCEKPIDLDLDRVKAVVQQGSRSHLPILIGFSRRFDANHLRARQVVERGEIGKIEMIHITARDSQPPPLAYVQISGGQLRDQTIHFFDMACWLADEAPIEVYATGSALVDPAIGEVGDVDTTMLILKMPSGALCHINNSRRAAYGYDEHFEIFGSQGMVESRRKPTGDVSLYISSAGGNQVTSSGMYTGWFDRMEPTFRLALDAFVRAVEGEKTVYPTLMDGLRAQLIAEAATQSLKSNQPVKITYWQPE
jgi:myo-inositol 2-dehydrogenase/D-chiro-inositol 1-dehydrogenase